MRILLLADVHANWPALEAVKEKHDVALFLGDAVEYGVEPGACVDWVRRHCRYGVRGNHDHGAAHDVVSVPVQNHGFKFLTTATRKLGRERLSAADRLFLAHLPLTKFLTLDGVSYLLVHATPRDPLDEYAPPEVDFWARRLEGVKADIVCVAHTHRPYTLQVNGTLVVNPGSVGLQRDGDPRASYAVIENRNVELKRIDYAIDETIADVDAAPLPDIVKQMLTSVYRTGKLPNGNGMPG